MFLSVKKKNVLVVGGSKGIGANIVKKYMCADCSVAFLYNNSHEEAKQLELDSGAIAVCCDVSNSLAVSESIDLILNRSKIEGFDIVIYNAGISEVDYFDNMDTETWNRIIDINLNGAFYVLKNTTPHMIREKKGKIVVISSMWGQVGAAMEVAYSTSKAGLIGLTKSLAKELGPSGINVNCVAPGLIETDMNKEIRSEDITAMIEETPIQRIGSLHDITECVYYLTSDAASFITGQIIGINGGLVM